MAKKFGSRIDLRIVTDCIHGNEYLFQHFSISYKCTPAALSSGTGCFASTCQSIAYRTASAFCAQSFCVCINLLPRFHINTSLSSTSMKSFLTHFTIIAVMKKIINPFINDFLFTTYGVW